MKKQLSVFLFGALLLGAAGTFTSCKDYDDDIANLQGQIDGQASDLQSKLEGVNSAISSLQSAQSGVQSAIDEAKDAAEAAAAAAQAAAIEAAKEQLESVKAELEAAIAASTGDIEELKAAAQAAETDMAEAKGRIEALESFQTNTEKSLKDLLAADQSLETSITELSEETKKTLEEHGNRLTLIEAQIEALNHYNDSVNLEGQIDDVRKQLFGLDSLEQAVSDVVKELAAHTETNDAEIESLKKKLADALATLGSNGTEIDGLQGDVAALQKELESLKNGQLGQADLDAIKQQVTDLVNEVAGEIKTQMEDLSAQITAINAKLNVMWGTISGMVTSVELVYSYALQAPADYTNPYDPNDPNAAFKNWKLTFSNAVEKDNTFEEKGWGAKHNFSDEIADPITFTAGKQYQIPATFIIRVSPTNAELKKEQISLVNSNGNNLDGLLTIDGVDRYSELLTTRAADKSGLWKVTVKVTDYDEATFNQFAYANPAAPENERKSILYAVQVNNTVANAEAEDLADANRYVTSSYDLTLAYQDFEPANELYYFVKNSLENKHVKEINNRFDFTSKSLPNYNGSGTPWPEKKWKDAADDTPATEGNDNNTEPDSRDDRSDDIDIDVFPAIQREPITISLTNGYNDTEPIAPSNIRAMYVTLDYKENAVESAPSEWNAWNDSYTYTGLNKVVEGTEAKITINAATAINDYIGFRVYAVNYDGTLVDPDGKAFYVKVGTGPAPDTKVETTITPRTETANDPSEKSDTRPASVGKVTGAATAEWVTDKIGSTPSPVFHAVFVDANNRPVLKTDALGDLTSTDFSRITRAYTVPALANWYDYTDDGTWTGTLTVKDADKFVLKTITVTMTKKLPTGLPKEFSVKTGQKDENTDIYDCYLIPSSDGSTPSWAVGSAKYGTMDLDNVFNWGTSDPTKYEFTFAAADKDGDKTVNNTTATANGDAKDVDLTDIDLKVPAIFINNETSHATTVYYNYGDISSKQHPADYKQSSDEGKFQTVFHCIYDNTYKWDWSGRAPEFTYGSLPAEWNGVDIATKIEGTSDHDALYNATQLKTGYYPEGQTGNSVEFVSGEIITNDGTGNKKNEYFTVQKDEQGNIVFVVTNEAAESNPIKPVDCTLVLQYKDMYGHADKYLKIELPMKVNPR